MHLVSLDGDNLGDGLFSRELLTSCHLVISNSLSQILLLLFVTGNVQASLVLRILFSCKHFQRVSHNNLFGK